MHIYRCGLELLDYLFFATTERGKTFETGPFIHNYALTYALAAAGALVLPATRPRYYYEQQRPDYEGELRPLNERGTYVTPARPTRLTFRQTQFNTIKEGYSLGGKARSIAYPDWGFLRLISPGSHFVFFVLSRDPLPRRAYLRLGKFLSKARVQWWEAESVRDVPTGPFEHRGLLNWRDLVRKPTIFDLLPAALPSKLIDNARFSEGRHWIARFGQLEMALPIEMEYLPAGEDISSGTGGAPGPKAPGRDSGGKEPARPGRGRKKKLT
ncbi:MAG: type I-D CRISPR-associated protein Cas5/Csc1 [Candidatus Tectomicrobia bacterium]|uniref:Type I-D CRISPR-associated protein Cas5/Csc1 n=1 Tax=Tectimicrobiota bacterium TaxID=2528274 RepID=A0A932FZT4_UNCTE|nr:type I-D CRISPR-associated protein Cas5/Csc1 [Candidatus Tectomicrobia bacterium]